MFPYPNHAIQSSSIPAVSFWNLQFNLLLNFVYCYFSSIHQIAICGKFRDLLLLLDKMMDIAYS